MAEWEQHFNKLQHGLTFDENNPDVIDISEDENCNKILIQNDAGSSQDKLYDKHKIYITTSVLNKKGLPGTSAKVYAWQFGQTFKNVGNIQHVWNVGNVPGRVRRS